MKWAEANDFWLRCSPSSWRSGSRPGRRAPAVLDRRARTRRQKMGYAGMVSAMIRGRKPE